MQIPAVLVLGATGRLGGMLARHWCGPGAAAVRWSARRAGPGGPSCQICDPLGDPAALARLARGCDAVLCLAGVPPGHGGDWADNTRLALAAMTAGQSTGARVFLTSSAAVYGPAAGVLDESRALTPVADYGRAKADMEDAALTRAAATGQPLTILRIGNVAGADAALGGWRDGFTLDVFPNGTTPARSYIGPASLSHVLARLCAAQDLPDVLNIAAPGPVQMGALLDAATLPWTQRPAPDTAIPRVELATDRLTSLVPLPAATPAALVAEWRADQTRAGS